VIRAALGEARRRRSSSSMGRGAMLALATLALACSLTGCETTQQKSAKLEKEAKKHIVVAQSGLSIARASTDVQVVATTVLHSSEGAAVAVTLRNTSTHALRDVPIAISVNDAAGSVLYQNNAPGLEAALTSVPLLEPSEHLTWIDDQVQANSGAAGGTPTTATATVGEAPQAPAGAPRMRLSGVHQIEEASGAGAEGMVVNDSAVTQHGLVVYGIARQGATIVAAGRAVLSEVPARGSTHFQLYFIGSPHGARLQLSAPATTLG
jgi:hypothetical protein